MKTNAGLLIALGAAVYFLFFRKSTGPTYYNIQGQSISDILCGNTITFDVPGYSRVWLSQLKDGVLNFDGPYAVPMPPYILTCSTDVGIYDVAVYELNDDDTKGDLIGQTRFTVLSQTA